MEAAPPSPAGDECARALPQTPGFRRNHAVVVHREESSDDTWVELAPRHSPYLGDRLLRWPRRLVGSIMGERVKDVGHGDYAADERDVLAGKSRGYPVPSHRPDESRR